MTRLKFLIAWGQYSKGAIITPPSALQRDRLLATVWYGQRVVEVVKDDPIPESTPEPEPDSEPKPPDPQPQPEPVPAGDHKRKKRYQS